jgi:hypothetical protein
MMPEVSIHRFHNLIAINPPDGATFYLEPSAAKRLANALKATADSIETETFAASDLPKMAYPVAR